MVRKKKSEGVKKALSKSDKAWLGEQKKKLKALGVKDKALKVKAMRLKVAFVTTNSAKGRILAAVKKWLENTSLSFKEWVEKNTDIGYSTALFWIDLAQHSPQVEEWLKNSNPLESTVRRLREALRDWRQAQGKGKPGSGKRKAATRPKKNHPFEGENVPQVVHKDSLSWVLRERWVVNKADPAFKPPQQSEEDFTDAHFCFQQAKNPGSTYATVSQATGKDEGEVKRLLHGLDIDRVDAEWAEFRRQAENRLADTEESFPASTNTPTAPPDWKGERIRNVPLEKDAKIEGDNSPPEEQEKKWVIGGSKRKGVWIRPPYRIEQRGKVYILQKDQEVLGDFDAVDKAQEAADKDAEYESVKASPNKPVYLFNQCHNFRLSGNTLQATDQQGATVILVAPKGQRIADLLKDALGENKPAQTKKRRAAK